MKITPENFSSVLFADIQEIVNVENGRTEAFVERMAESAKRRVIETSPVYSGEYGGKREKRKAGSYKNGWTLKKEFKNGYRQFVITNKKEPTLTHLLEFGTATRTTKAGKNRGRMKKQPHIRAAFDETIAEYAQKKI